jgi:hypothetical protein
MIVRAAGETFEVTTEPWWAGLLRLASGMRGDEPEGK